MIRQDGIHFGVIDPASKDEMEPVIGAQPHARYQ